MIKSVEQFIRPPRRARGALLCLMVVVSVGLGAPAVDASPVTGPVSVILRELSTATEDSVSIGDRVLVELFTISETDVPRNYRLRVSTSSGEPDGVIMEFAGNSHGTSEFEFVVGRETDSQSNQIAANIGDILTVWLLDATGGDTQDTMTVIGSPLLGVLPPLRVKSPTHPALFWMDFNAELEGVNASGGVSAEVDHFRLMEGEIGSLHLVNRVEGGSFFVTLIDQPFDVTQYPFFTFDYFLPSEHFPKINFLVRVDGKWHDLVFTDDSKDYTGVDLSFLGEIPGARSDSDVWRRKTVNLGLLIQNKTNSRIVEKIAMADWDVTGFKTLVGGTNPAGSELWLDHLTIHRPGGPAGVFEIESADPSRRVDRLNYAVDNSTFYRSRPRDKATHEFIESNDRHFEPPNNPARVVQGDAIEANGLGGGSLAFRVRAIDPSVGPGPTANFPIFVDLESVFHDGSDSLQIKGPGPVISPLLPLRIHVTGSRTGTGLDVDTNSIRLRVGTTTYTVDARILSFKELTGELIFNVSQLNPIPFTEGQTVEVVLEDARDMAGNGLVSPINWTVTYRDAKLLITEVGFEGNGDFVEMLVLGPISLSDLRLKNLRGRADFLGNGILEAPASGAFLLSRRNSGIPLGVDTFLVPLGFTLPVGNQIIQVTLLDRPVDAVIYALTLIPPPFVNTMNKSAVEPLLAEGAWIGNFPTHPTITKLVTLDDAVQARPGTSIGRKGLADSNTKEDWEVQPVPTPGAPNVGVQEVRVKINEFSVDGRNSMVELVVEQGPCDLRGLSIGNNAVSLRGFRLLGSADTGTISQTGDVLVIHTATGTTENGSAGDFNKNGVRDIYLPEMVLKRSHDQIVAQFGAKILDAVAYGDPHAKLTDFEFRDGQSLLDRNEWTSAGGVFSIEDEVSLQAPVFAAGRVQGREDTNRKDDFVEILKPNPGVRENILSDARPGEILINEVQVEDLFGHTADWAELYNASNRPIDVSNWVLTDLDGPDQRLAESALTLQPGEFAQAHWIGAQGSLTETDEKGDLNGNGYRDIFLDDQGLFKTNDQLVLLAGNTLIDAVTWTDFGGMISRAELADNQLLVVRGAWQGSFTDTQDQSSAVRLVSFVHPIARIPNGVDSNQKSDWALAVATPGAPNAAFEKDVTPPRSQLIASRGLVSLNGTLFGSLTTEFGFTAEDDLVARPEVFFSLDGGDFSLFVDSFTFNTEGVHVVRHFAVDASENAEDTQTVEVAMDGTPPTTTFEIAGDLLNLIGQDGGSGVQSTFLAFDTGEFFPVFGSVQLPHPLPNRISFFSIDRVGNTEQTQTKEISAGEDKEPPSISIAPVQTPTRQDVTLQITVTDNVTAPERITISGNASPYTTEGLHNVAILAADEAGNTSTATVVFIIDRTAPGFVRFGPAGGETFVAKRDTIVISIEAKDAFDPDPIVFAQLAHFVGTTSDTALTVVDSRQIAPLSIPAGRWKLVATAKDAAGNIRTQEGGFFTVIHDALPPRTALTVGDPKFVRGSDSAAYITAATPLTFAAVDDLVTVGDAGGLGVAKIEVSVNGGAFATVAGPLTLTGLGEGKHTVSYRATDAVGNVEATQTTVLYIDTTAPVTTDSKTPAANKNGWNAADVSVSLSAVDPPLSDNSNSGSGVKETRLGVDGATPATSTSATTVSAEGVHTLAFFSVDNIGNTEAIRSDTVRIDRTAPALAVQSITPDSTGLGLDGRPWWKSPVTIAFSATDTLSGLDVGRTALNFTLPDEGKDQAVTGIAVDEADNTSSLAVTGINIDFTAPQTALAIGEPQVVDGQTFVTGATPFTLTAVDTLSGVAQTEFRLEEGGAFAPGVSFTIPAPERIRNIGFRSTDAAGNVEIEKTTEVVLDNTAPATTRSVDITDTAGTVLIPQSEITLTAVDGPALTPAVGVDRIEYQIDGGVTQVYSGAFSVSGLGPHTLTYRAFDRLGNAETTHTFNFVVSPALSASKFVSFAPRVLVWLNDPPSPKNVPDANVAALKSILDSAPILLYDFVDNPDSFIASMRTDSYNVYVIAGDEKDLDKEEAWELSERVRIGDGLVSSFLDEIEMPVKDKGEHEGKDDEDEGDKGKDKDDDKGKGKDKGKDDEHGGDDEGEEAEPEKDNKASKNLLGVDVDGKHSDKDIKIILTGAAITHSGDYQTADQTKRVRALASTAVGDGLITPSGKDKVPEPSVVSNAIGSGKTVFFAFDLGQSATPGNAGPTGELLNAAIQKVTPTKEVLIPDGRAAVGMTVRSLVVPLNLAVRIEEAIPAGAGVVNKLDGNIQSNSVIWNLTLDVNESDTVHYLLGLPNSGEAGLTTSADVSYVVRGNYILFDTLKLTLVTEKDLPNLLDQAITQLTTLNPTDKDDEEKVEDAVKELQEQKTSPSATKKDIEDALEEVLEIIRDLDGIDADPEAVSAIRETLDKVVMVYARKISSL